MNTNSSSIISVNIDNDTNDYLINAKAIKFVTKQILLSCNIDVCELSVRFVSSKTITQLNKGYRNRNQPTDVISFPQSNWPKAVTTKLPAPIIEHFNYHLGDIVISLPQAYENALAIEQPLGKEVCFLLLHGLLHLLGHDHHNLEESKLMYEQQRIIMATIEQHDPGWDTLAKKRG